MITSSNTFVASDEKSIVELNYSNGIVKEFSLLKEVNFQDLKIALVDLITSIEEHLEKANIETKKMIANNNRNNILNEDDFKVISKIENTELLSAINTLTNSIQKLQPITTKEQTKEQTKERVLIPQEFEFVENKGIKAQDLIVANYDIEEEESDNPIGSFEFKGKKINYDKRVTKPFVVKINQDTYKFIYHDNQLKEIISKYDDLSELKTTSINGQTVMYNPNAITADSVLAEPLPQFTSTLISENDLNNLINKGV